MSTEGPRLKRFLINARWSIGLKNKKTFFVFLVGRDKRLETQYPSQEKRHNTTLAQAIVYTGVLTWVLLGTIFLSISSLYIAKTYMGIDLINGSSPFPTFLEKIRLCHRSCKK